MENESFFMIISEPVDVIIKEVEEEEDHNQFKVLRKAVEIYKYLKEEVSKKGLTLEIVKTENNDHEMILMDRSFLFNPQQTHEYLMELYNEFIKNEKI